MAKSENEMIIDLVEKYFIPYNAVMNFNDWVKIRNKAKKLAKGSR